MPQWYLWALVAGVGFAAAGVLCALLRLTGNPSDGFGSLRNFPPGMVAALAVSMFAGPYLVAATALKDWRQGRLTPLVAMLAPPLALVWSFCAGVFVVEMAMWIGLIAA